MNRLIEALHSGRVLLMDGAMGTELQRLGLGSDPELWEWPALWNLTHAEQVCSVHAAYLEAGAEILLTNTFMVAPPDREYSPTHASEVFDAALKNARIFRDSSPIILADIGPLPNPAAPNWEYERYWEGFEFLDFCHGVDGLLMETWDASEPRRCLNSMISNRTRLNFPFLISFAFRHESKTLVAEAKHCADFATRYGASALGANCGVEVDMADLLKIVHVYHGETELPIFIRPNAGTPARTYDACTYPRSAAQMADELWPLLEAGVTMVGGCCGTTPAHIAAFRRVVDEWNRQQAKK